MGEQDEERREDEGLKEMKERTSETVKKKRKNEGMREWGNEGMRE
jgi:hypothetical protein